MKFCTFLVLTCLLLQQLTYHTNAVVIKTENLPERCDLRKCTQPDPNKLNVHLVPHTHDDVGWLKTVEQYYWGTLTNYAKAGVQYILDSVVEELIRNKERRFIYVETAFFWKWWTHQNNEQKAIVHELVKTGQLEFINGGWSMNDEATCHYNSIIDQMTWGLRRLNDTFGKCGVPKIAWQIDPFGHSREQANLFAQMNFDAVFFAREDYADHRNRQNSKTLENVWQGSDDLGKSGDLFTGMMHMGYGPPRQFNWDLVAMGGDDEPVIDDENSDEYNVPRMVKKLVDSAIEYSKVYATNNIMFPMGTDFQYQDAHIYFKNMDKLIHYVNSLSNDVKVFYSTPSCYAKSLNDYNITWTGKNDDYFPYASDPHAYWTGYFSSRPSIKRFEKIGNNILQACKQIDALSDNGDKFEAQVTELREMMGVMQHHDAVTGTEKQHVSNNYAKHLDIALNKCFDVIHRSFESKFLSKKANSYTLKQQTCQFLNISDCPVTEAGKDFVVNLYNPLAQSISGKLIRLPVDHDKFYTVVGPSGQTIDATLVKIPEYVQTIPGRVSKAKYELVFGADLPALGLVTYFVKVTPTAQAGSATDATETTIVKETVLKSKTFNVHFNATGGLSSIIFNDGRKVSLTNDFHYYFGHTGDNSNYDLRASGAYIFRPSNNQSHSAGKIVEAKLFTQNNKGEANSNIQEVHQKFDSYISQIIRVDALKDIIEFEWVVGPIPVNTKASIGKEVVVQFSTDLQNNKTFYTDANGRQLLKRVWNYRPSWRYQVEELISGNYYPVNSRILLRDEKKDLQLTVLNDRSQGGTSPKDGTLELMVHRRLLLDDSFGVGEALNEIFENKGLVIRGKHVLLLESISKSASKHRPLAQQILIEPFITFASDIDEAKYREQFYTKISSLNKELPKNVHLLTLEQWKQDTYLIRLEHIFQKGEDSELSQPVTVHLQNLFKQFEIVNTRELTLSANADISATENRMKFKYTAADNKQSNNLNKVNQFTTLTTEDPFEIKLEPMQIRTFEVRIKRK